MQILFIICLGFVLGYIVLMYRKFDYFSIAAISSVIYYYPCLLGTISIVNVRIPLPGKVYGCICTFLIVLFIFMIISDNAIIKVNNSIAYNPNKKREGTIGSDRSTNFAVFIVELIGLLMLVKVYISYGGFGLNFNKMQLLAESNRFTEYLKYIALFTFVYSFVNKGKYININRILAMLLIGYTFLLGHRSFIVIGIITIFMHYVGSDDKVYLWRVIKKHWFIFWGMLLAAFFFLFVKNVFAALMSGQYDLVISRLTDPEYYMQSLLKSEANSITSNLYMVINNNVSYDFFQYILGVVLLIPVLGGSIAGWIGYESFERKINLLFNTRLEQGVGLGSTYLGEAYAMGGCFMVALIMTITFCFLLFLIYKQRNTHSNLAYVFYGIMATYFTFYIHRNSLSFLLITARAYIYIWMLIWTIRKLSRALFLKGR